MVMKPSSYTLNYLCFACRKAYKQPALRTASGHYVSSPMKKGSSKAAEEIETERHRCPQCQAPMVYAGRKVVVPPATKDKAWAELERQFTSRTRSLHSTPR